MGVGVGCEEFSLSGAVWPTPANAAVLLMPGTRGGQGSSPGCLHPCLHLQPVAGGVGWEMLRHTLPCQTSASPQPDPAPPGGLNSALYIRQVKRHQQSPLPGEHPWVLQHPRSAAPMLGTLGGPGGPEVALGEAGEGWGTRSKCLCVIKAVVPSWKGES